MLNSCDEPGAASDAPDYGDEPLSASQSSDFAPHRGSVKNIELLRLIDFILETLQKMTVETTAVVSLQIADNTSIARLQL